MDHQGSGGGWIGTFVFSLALWGGILALTVFVGHHLANMVSGH